jgi:hypothetical protein
MVIRDPLNEIFAMPLRRGSANSIDHGSPP